MGEVVSAQGTSRYEMGYAIVCNCLSEASVDSTIRDCFFCRLSVRTSSRVLSKASFRLSRRASACSIG